MQRAEKGLPKNISSFVEIGVHVVTLGNHAWDNREVFEFIDQAKVLVRPANFPIGTPGKGIVFVHVEGYEVAIISLQGRTFLPAIDCPFKKRMN